MIFFLYIYIYRDTGEWAIPGGMVEAGENVSLTLRREFSEEALDIDGKNPVSKVCRYLDLCTCAKIYLYIP